MKTAKKMLCALMLASLMLVMLGTAAFATESGSAWLYVTGAEDGNTTVSIVVNTAVTDAYVELTFDSSVLSCANVECNAQYVDVHSINTDEAGLVKLAWVSGGTYEAGQGVAVATLTFTGAGDAAIAMSGELYDAAGNALTIGETIRETVDKTELTKAVLAASGLKAEHYTEDSFAALQTALAAAQAVLENSAATQDTVDAATAALNDAMDALVLVSSSSDAEIVTDALEKLILKAEGLQRIMYSADSFAAMEEALDAAKAVLENPEKTQSMVNEAAATLRAAINALVLVSGEAPDTGASFLTVPVALILVLSAAGIAAAVCLLLRKKGRCA